MLLDKSSLQFFKRLFGRLLLLALLQTCAAISWAQPVTFTESSVSRRADDGSIIKYPVTLDGISSQSDIVLVVIPSSVRLGSANGSVSEPSFLQTEPVHYPMTRSRAPLLAAGLAIAWVAVPKTAGLGNFSGNDPRFLSDLEDLFTSLKRQFPKARLVTVTTDGAAAAGMGLAMRGSKHVDGQLVLSPFWPGIRDEKIQSASAANALVIYDGSNQCYTASQLETLDYLQRTGWKSIAVFPDKLSNIGFCGAGSSHMLTGIENQLPAIVQDWLQKKPLPAVLGVAKSGVQERIVMAAGKQGKLEVTLLLPNTRAPHPLVIFNHGDMEIDSVWVKQRRRYVDVNVASTLLRQGYAVAIPARPGVGRSDGTYRYGQFAINDGDPSFKARTHAQAVMDAISALRNEPDLDLERFVLAGQSAGGDTVMYMSTMAIDGLKGVINFAGGRSNHAAGQAPNFENKMMISGWGEMGAQAKVPVQLVFAENDSRYSANTIRKSFEAFSTGGGKAKLLLVPPLAGDGHYIHSQPAIWSKVVADFLGDVLK